MKARIILIVLVLSCLVAYEVNCASRKKGIFFKIFSSGRGVANTFMKKPLNALVKCYQCLVNKKKKTKCCKRQVDF